MPRAATRKADQPVTTGAMHGDKPIQRTVPAASATNVFSAANSVFGTRKSARGGRRTMLPNLDLAQLLGRTDLPLPTTVRGNNSKGRTRYDAVFDALTQDGASATNIPIEYRQALAKAIRSYMRHRPQLAATSCLVVRATPDGMCGVWRQAKAGG